MTHDASFPSRTVPGQPSGATSPEVPGGRSLSRRAALGTLGSLALLPLGVQAAIARPGAESSTSTPTGAIRSYDDMIRELAQIERSSQGQVTVRTLAEIGTAETRSEQGRELYVAQVGHGDRHVWIMGRIHGDEPYGLEATLAVLKALGSSGQPAHRRLREEFTLHIIPMYNPDGSEMNTRTTTLWDREANAPRRDAQGAELTVDLNRDWTAEGFLARESRAWYEYWTMVRPSYALDIHHQGQKLDPETGEPITFSLGVSLAPGGPTLPGIRDGEFDVLTRQMASQVWLDTRHRGHITADRYDVGGGQVIDIRGGVVSAMMLGLDWAGLNPDGHAHAAIFFETSGNTRDGDLGQRGRGKFVQQNILGVESWLEGLASGETFALAPEIWEEIPHAPVEYYFTDWGGVIPVS
ncbi:M14 family zinc carboxypeptidase [Nesterenkonia sp. HG001]|uniref:M14 family zinc carboxypeptidase n=1 Tax=Nesterenkonia sp. HG001 TaxID=2983207 RepID=UPI002AC3E9A5|nr:M14 family zinc carboxypeptidase [Nesterenkonia sp. HG001]MDZ5078395.1 M14 family zinc carboxypeptidase [Nesterenkonia sp. HG001]